MRKRTQAREHALQVLYTAELNPAPPDELLTHLDRLHPDLPPEIKSYIETLVRGTLEHIKEIDQVITKYAANWHLDRMATVDRNILRFATFELLFMAEIPPKVAINEAVNIAKKFSQEDSGKFVNGILDKINHTEPVRVPKKS